MDPGGRSAMTTPRTFVVGDLHGCARELDALLDEAGYRPGDDRLVSVGDVVAKGPDSAGVVRRLRTLGARSVRGNHDHRLLLSAAALAAGDADPPDGQRRLLASLGEGDLDWLGAQPLALRLPEHDAIVVHAGLVPGVPLDAQDPENLMTMRSLRDDGRPSRRIGDGVPWSTRWPGPELVLFGHDAVRGLQERPHALGLDTGCVYGGRLTGVWLPDRRIVSVPAAANYAPVR